MRSLKSMKKQYEKERRTLIKTKNQYFKKAGVCVFIGACFLSAGFANIIYGERSDSFIKTTEFVLNEIEEEA